MHRWPHKPLGERGLLSLGEHSMSYKPCTQICSFLEVWGEAPPESQGASLGETSKTKVLGRSSSPWHCRPSIRFRFPSLTSGMSAGPGGLLGGGTWPFSLRGLSPGRRALLSQSCCVCPLAVKRGEEKPGVTQMGHPCARHVPSCPSHVRAFRLLLLISVHFHC